VLLLALVLQACGTGLSMVSDDQSITKKKRAKSGGGKRFVKDVVLKPETWKAAISALDFFLKLVRVVAKGWDYFT
jgi:hypothetical protein